MTNPQNLGGPRIASNNPQATAPSGGPQNLGGPRIVSNNPQATAPLGQTEEILPTVNINGSTYQPKVLKWKVTRTLQEKLDITNPSPPNFVAGKWTADSSEKWLQLNPSTGTDELAAGKTETIEVIVDTTNLKHGNTYTASAHFIWTNYAGPDNGDTLEITFNYP